LSKEPGRIRGAEVRGSIQIVPGLLFLTGNALGLILVHIVSGLVLVLSLRSPAVLAALAGVNRSTT
jgi:hypothetical protein